MNEIIKELIKINNIGDVAITMLVILGTIYLIKQAIQLLISKNLEIVKSQNNKEIEKLKSELDKQKQQLEHIHQVSQVTYQKLFEKKIEIYQSLLQVLQKYKIKEKENYNPFEDSGDTIYKHREDSFTEIKEIEHIIEGNQLYISNKLLKKYEALIRKIDDSNSKFDELSIYLYQSNMNDVEYENYEYTEKQKIYNEIYKKVEAEFLNFKEVLHDDISTIKKKINLD
jgi:hypothetical protein